MATIVDREPAIEDFAVTQDALDTLERLKSRAMQRTGLTDFGSTDFEKPLGLLLDEAIRVPRRLDWESEIETSLMGRLVLVDEWKRNPGYKDRTIVAPLVICGIPRTGTTALHKVLSVDPQFQGLNLWLASWPKPRPPQDRWVDEPGYQHAVALLEKRNADTPGLRAVHEMLVDEVEECLEILRYDFVTNRFPSITLMPRYDRWMQAQDQTPSYRNLADALKLIGLHDDRRWLLKNPGHFGNLDALFAVFPDARVVITHRDPVKSIGSVCSVLQNPQQFMDPNVDLHKVGAREVQFWGDAKAKTDAIRETERGAQILDVQHKDFHADPIGIVRAIYDHAGLVLNPDVEQDMRTWLAQNPSDKHGQHTYKLSDYGLTEERIRAVFGEG